VSTAEYFTGRCPSVSDPSALIDCRDRPIPARQLARVSESLSVRTLLIRSGDNRPLRVNLHKVKIDRGPRPDQGSRSDSAGIWLDGADRVDFSDVEITGNGKGYGLQITNARNVTLTNLWVHDLVWAPYRGDKALSRAAVAAAGWNNVPIREFREQRSGGPRANFYGVRIQEQLTCVSMSNVSHVRINNVRIERCLARFDTGDLPWQADGLTIGPSSSDISINRARIDSTWEAVDVVGGGSGIDGLQINDLTASNSFSFGLKMGYRLRNARISRLTVRGAGLAGVMVYGPVRNVRISGASIQNAGMLLSRGGRYSPWPGGNRTGIRIDGSDREEPQGVVVEDVSISGQPGEMDFGILNTTGRRVQLVRFQAKGFGKGKAGGIEQAP
jgi:hypothetical protein